MVSVDDLEGVVKLFTSIPQITSQSEPMTKNLSLLGLCVVLAGCSSAGRQQQQPLFSQGTQPATTTAPQVAEEDSGFSFGKVLQFVGFNKKEELGSAVAQAGALSPGVTQLQQSIAEVAARASVLNANDAPEATRQKALGILDSLNGLEQQLAAGKSTGNISGRLSQTFENLIGRIRGEAQRVSQGLSTPQSIPMIQQLAGNLQSTSSTISGVLGQVNTATQAIANQGLSYPTPPNQSLATPPAQGAVMANQPHSPQVTR